MFMAYFFRDPERRIPSDPDVIVSAADGRVTRIDENENGKTVSVFLSPLDVHINRVADRRYDNEGRLYQRPKRAGDDEPGELRKRRNSLTIEGEKMTVVCTQIAGILAVGVLCAGTSKATNSASASGSG